MRFARKIIILFTILTISFFYFFLNLGNFLDVTSNPKKVDLLVCLGGGDYVNRGKKTLELFENEFVKTKTIIFTGYTNIKDFKGANIIVNRRLQNTYEEVIYVKDYMRTHKLKSVIFVSEVPHSRRILLFSNFFGNGDFEVSVVGSKFIWDAENYYKYPQMRAYVFREVVKLTYNFFLYGILEKIDLKEVFENNFKQEIKEVKREILSTFK